MMPFVPPIVAEVRMVHQTVNPIPPSVPSTEGNYKERVALEMSRKVLGPTKAYRETSNLSEQYCKACGQCCHQCIVTRNTRIMGFNPGCTACLGECPPRHITLSVHSLLNNFGTFFYYVNTTTDDFLRNTENPKVYNMKHYPPPNPNTELSVQTQWESGHTALINPETSKHSPFIRSYSAEIFFASRMRSLLNENLVIHREEIIALKETRRLEEQRKEIAKIALIVKLARTVKSQHPAVG